MDYKLLVSKFYRSNRIIMKQSLWYTLLQKKRKKFVWLFVRLFLWSVFFMWVTSFVYNVRQSIVAEIKPILGADLRIESNTWRTQAQLDAIASITTQYDAQYNQKVSFFSTLAWSGETVSFSVIWVQTGYPYYGEVVLDWEKARNIDLLANKWVLVDKWLLSILWDQNTIKLWDNIFEVRWAFEEIPWAMSANPLDEGRSILVLYDQIIQTDLVGLWSRVWYELSIKTTVQEDIQPIKDFIKSQEIFYGYDIDDYESSSESIQDRIADFYRFLGLIIAASVLLVWVIVYFLIHSFFVGEQKHWTLLALFWINKKHILWIIISGFAIVSVLSFVTAYAISYVIFEQLGQLEITEWFFLDTWSVIKALIISWVFVAISLIPHVVNFANMPVLQWLQASQSLTWSKSEKTSFLVLGVIWVISVYWLMYENALDWILWWIWTCLVIWGIALLGQGVMYALYTMQKKIADSKKSTYTFARMDWVRRLVKPWNMTWLLSASLWITMILLLVVWSISLSFQKTLEESQNDVPWLFALNILKENAPNIEKILEEEQKKASSEISYTLYGRIAARIETINNTSLTQYLDQKEGVTSENENTLGSWNTLSWQNARWGFWWRWRFTREFNTTDSELASDPIVAWTTNLGIWEMSLDEQFAEDLWVGIWDTIGISIIWRTFELKVVWIRWRSTSPWPFFFIQLPREWFEDAPKTFFLSVDTDKQRAEVIQNRIVQEIWNHITFIDTWALFDTISELTNSFIQAILTLFGILFVFGLSVFWYSVQQSQALDAYIRKLYNRYWATIQYMNIYFWSQRWHFLWFVIITWIVLAWVAITFIYSSRNYFRIARWESLFVLVVCLTTIFVILFTQKK